MGADSHSGSDASLDRSLARGAAAHHDIFRANAYQTGILSVTLPDRQVRHLIDLASEGPTTEITVDLERQELRRGGFAYHCEIDAFAHYAGRTPRPAISAFESQRAGWLFSSM